MTPRSRLFGPGRCTVASLDRRLGGDGACARVSVAPTYNITGACFSRRLQGVRVDGQVKAIGRSIGA